MKIQKEVQTKGHERVDVQTKKERLRNYEKERLLKTVGLTEVELCGEFHECYK